jgi:hypothetical protein
MSPEWKEHLQEFGWVMLNGLCLLVVGMVRDLAHKQRTKWTYLLTVPFVCFLGFEGWVLLKRIGTDLFLHWRDLMFPGVCAFAYYAWLRGNEYRRELEQLREQENGRN